MRIELTDQRMRRRMLLAAAVLASAVGSVPYAASAEGLFDMFFSGLQKQRQTLPQANFFADPSQQSQTPAPSSRVASGGGPAFCVRSCDGKYFPLTRANASPEAKRLHDDGALFIGRPSENGIGCTTVSSPWPARFQSAAVSVSNTPGMAAAAAVDKVRIRA